MCLLRGTLSSILGAGSGISGSGTRGSTGSGFSGAAALGLIFASSFSLF